ncbi:hypothetical protein J4558_14765 [Leptolyngbya sp. 15MV]|nr:hypothetical protein J4558_14765 [Leptolyngbya sp. 15MV]
MTIGSFLVLVRREELPVHRSGVAKVVFSLPEGFTVRSVVRNTIAFALSIQVVGAGALWWAFREAGSSRPLWDAIFHSVSAFCTAGFGLYGDSLESFRGDFWINAIVGVLSVLGAIGFLVMTDLYRRFTRRTPELTLTTRIVLWGAAAIIGGGALLLYLFEPAIRTLPPHERAVASLFQAMSASTTVGFNTVPIAPLSEASTALLLLLMVVGAAPAGTGGGLKITTITAVIAVVLSTLRGSTPVTFARRELPLDRVRAAVASMGLSLMVLMIGVYLLALSETAPLVDLAFEATSALGTVGLSRGVTASLSPMGQLVIIALMYIGRVGPTVLAMSILTRHSPPPVGREDISV